MTQQMKYKIRRQNFIANTKEVADMMTTQRLDIVFQSVLVWGWVLLVSQNHDRVGLLTQIEYLDRNSGD